MLKLACTSTAHPRRRSRIRGSDDSSRRRPPDSSAHPRRPARPVDRPEPSSAGGRAPSILVIDDEPGIREALGLILEDYDIPCLTAEHGRIALDLLSQGPRPDIILLDLMMPNMDGWEFRAAQLADPALADIPTIVLSAVNQSDRQDRELGLDAAHRLRKPIDLNALLTVIQELAPDWQPED